MRPVSAALTAAISGSHRMAARARVVAPGQSGTDPAGTFLRILDGSVTQDATAAVRGTLDLTIDGTGWDPRVGAHPVQPYGAEIFVERGVQVSGGSIEWVGLGYYRIYDVDQDQAPDGELRISGQDRMSAIVDSRLTTPRQYAKTAMVSAVINDLVLDVLPGTVIDFTIADYAIGRAQVTEDDRAGFFADIITTASAVAYWDYRGHLVIAPAPDPETVVWEVAAGLGGVLVSASRSLSRDGVYNAVVATSDGTDDAAPVQAIAYDNDPRSPTYFHGPFGQVPEFYASPLITTKAQAQSAARTMLAAATGLPYNLSLTAVPHPGLEALDVVRVRYPRASETHILDKITMPLTPSGAMSATTRQQTSFIIGVG